MEQNSITAIATTPEQGLAQASPQTVAISYENISAKPLNAEQAGKIVAEPPLAWVKKRPDGMIYVDGVHYRETLDNIFGVGGWALRPTSSHIEPGEMNGKKMARVFVQGQLWAEGRFISESVGEDTYYYHNNNDSYATAWEKAKSNLLVRCCKELGLFRKMWDKDWVDSYKSGRLNRPANVDSDGVIQNLPAPIIRKRTEARVVEAEHSPKSAIDLSIFEVFGMEAIPHENKFAGKGYAIKNHAFMDQGFWSQRTQTKAQPDEQREDKLKGTWIKGSAGYVPFFTEYAMPVLINELAALDAKDNAPKIEQADPFVDKFGAVPSGYDTHTEWENARD
jgi:hypothetical protein